MIGLGLGTWNIWAKKTQYVFSPIAFIGDGQWTAAELTPLPTGRSDVIATIPFQPGYTFAVSNGTVAPSLASLENMTFTSGAYRFTSATVIAQGATARVRIARRLGAGAWEWISNEKTFLVASGSLAAITNLNTINKDGVTLTFWTAATGGSLVNVPVMQDALGDYAIHTGGLASTVYVQDVVDAPATPNGMDQDGFVKNADFDDETQGFDGALIWGATTSAGSMAYSATKNISFGRTGTRAPITVGENATFTKWRRRPDAILTASHSGNSWQVAAAHVQLTCLSSRPLEGFFIPSPSATTKTIEGVESQINYSVLRSLAPVSGQPTSVVPTKFDPVPIYGIAGEKHRRIAMEVLNGNSSSNYGPDYGAVRAEELLRLHTNAAQVDKRLSMARMVRFGLWVWQDYSQKGWVGGSGAGQRFGYLPYVVLAGFALNRPDILSGSLNIISNMTGQPFWADGTLLGRSYLWSSVVATDDTDRRNRTAFPQDIDQVWMAQQNIPSGPTTSFDVAQRYLTGSSPAMCHEIMAIALLQNGPPGFETGDAWLRGGTSAADNSTNRRSAILRWVDTYRALNKPFEAPAGSLPGWFTLLYDTHRPLLSTPRPQRAPLHNVAITNRLTAGSGSFSYDFTPVDLVIDASLPNTRRDLRYSIDGVQFVDVSNCGNTGTINNLVRTKHFVQERRANSIGNGVWSDNYSYSNANPTLERYTVTPTGTPANAAPTFAVAPVGYIKPYPAWAGPYYEPVGGSLALEQTTLFAGAGYPGSATHPAPSISYQWRRDGVNISGATGQSYLRVVADAVGTIPSCVVTYTNGSGSVNSTLTFPAWPAIPAIPVGTIVNTQFDTTWPLIYSTISATATVSGSAYVHSPAVEFTRIVTGTGAVFADKAGSFPRLSFDLGVLAAGTYAVEVEIPVGYSPTGANHNWSTTGTGGFFRVSSTPSGGTIYQPGGVAVVIPITGAGVDVDENPIPDTPQYLFTHTGTFTVPGGVNVWATVGIVNSSGGTAGGDPAISRLRITGP